MSGGGLGARGRRARVERSVGEASGHDSTSRVFGASSMSLSGARAAWRYSGVSRWSAMWYMWMRSSAGSCMNGKILLGGRGAVSAGSEVCDSVNRLDSGVARPLRKVAVESPGHVCSLRPALASLFSLNLLDARGGSACSCWSTAVLRRVRLPAALPPASPAMLHFSRCRNLYPDVAKYAV